MRAPPPPPRVEKKRPKAPPPKPVYVAPPAPWQATRPAPVDFRNIKEDRPPSPPAPVRPATLKLPPWSANPWGTAPQPPAALTKDFPALAQPRTPLILRVPVSERERPKKGFLKPKPQRNFVVFDVLAAKKKKKKKVVPKAKVPEVVQPPPRLAPGKVRKKRLSSLKKRILLERQEKYYDLHPEMRPATMVREEVPWEAFVDATGLEKRFVVRVENACTALELEDEEERAEILTDVGDICASYAEVIAVEVGDESADFVPIDVSFASRDEALKALAGLQKRVVGGLVLQAEPLRPPAKDASCALRVYDVLDEDEFEDEDCRDEVLEDLSRLACVHGALATPPESALTASMYLLAPHAKFLQPVLENRDLVWGLARGNSEVQVAKGEAPIEMVELVRAKPNHKPGFAPEWYEPGEDAFYVRRETLGDEGALKSPLGE